MLSVLIPFIAHLAQMNMRTYQALVQQPLYIFHRTSFTIIPFMSAEPLLPLLKILENHNHGVGKLRSTHGTADRRSMVLFVIHPHLQTLRMHTFVTSLTGGVTISPHIFLMTDRADGILLQRREVFLLLFYFLFLSHEPCLLLNSLLTFLPVFVTNQPIEFGIQIRTYITHSVPCQIMG